MTSATWYLGSQVAGFLLTYSLHSTLLLGAAWILSRFAIRREAWRDMAWKVALVGSVVTTVAAQLPARDWAPRASVPLPSGFQVSVGEAVAPSSVRTPTELSTDRPALSREAGFPIAQRPVTRPGEAQPVDVGPATPQSLWTLDGARGLVTAWGVIALLLLARLVRRRRRLHSVLRDRYPAPDGALTAMLEELRRSSAFEGPVRLSYSRVVATPLALGRSEICVPARLFDRLTEEEQRAALAHEIAHLVRRDPMWHHAAHVLAAVFFFQPLQVVAIKKLRESAEILADAWAARETGSPLDLARCLEMVARWVSANGLGTPAGSTPMAESGSPLMTRVRRLLDGRIEEISVPAASRVAALTALALFAGFAPSVLPRALAHEAVEEAPRARPRAGAPAFAESAAGATAPDGLVPMESAAMGPGSPASVSAVASSAKLEILIPEPVSIEVPTLAEVSLAPALVDLGQPEVMLASAPVRLEGIEAEREPARVREAPESWVVVSREVDPSDFGDFDDLGRIIDQWSMNELALEKRFGGMVVTHFRASRPCETLECRRMSRQGVNGLENPEPCGVRYFVDGVPLNQDLQSHGPRTSCGTIGR